MEWIRISPNKLKIMLTAEDARHYDLDCKDPHYADMITRAAFREILSDVEKETGFDASDDKTYIQMYPSKEGGCELFVTKVGLALAENKCEQAGRAPAKKKKTERAVEDTPLEERFFRFKTLEPLLFSCRVMLNSVKLLQSAVFCDEEGQWWLSLIPHAQTGTLSLAHIAELGQQIPSDAAKAFLHEHGKSICETDAVARFATL